MYILLVLYQYVANSYLRMHYLEMLQVMNFTPDHHVNKQANKFGTGDYVTKIFIDTL